MRKEAIYPITLGMNFTNYFNGDQSIIRSSLSVGNIYYLCQSMSCYRLFSTGSYNERYLNSTLPEKEKHWVRKAKGELMYDEYTSGRFHEWIVRYVSRTIVKAGLVDDTLMEEFLVDTGLTKKEIFSHCQIKLRLKYYLHLYFPVIYNCLKKIKNIVMRIC